MRVHPGNTAEINEMLAKAERDSPCKTTAEDLYALIKRIQHQLPVRIRGLRGTVLQTVLVSPCANQGRTPTSKEATWIRLMHDGKTWILEEVWRSTEGETFILLSVPAKHELAAQHIRSSLGMKML